MRYSVITGKISFFLLISIMFIPITGLGLTEPDEPEVPEVFGPEVKEVEETDIFDDEEHPALDTIFYQPVWKNITVTIADLDDISGILEITSNIMFSITNTNVSPVQVDTFYLDEIQSIEITKWKATQYMNKIYKFIPSEYIITCEEEYEYSGNIDYFNSLVIEEDDTETAVFSIFFDKWTVSDSGYFHWENTKGYDFSYNFTHPMTGVLYKIVLSEILED